MLIASEVNAMRYFFDIVDQDGATLDKDGVELGGLEQVRREARRALAEIAAEEPYRTDRLNLTIHVRDGTGQEVYNICLRIEGRAA